MLKDTDNQRVLPIWVGPVEANAIALQIENVAPPRPMTHDLFRRLAEALRAAVSRVVIADLKGSTYYAYVEVVRDSERCSLTRGPATRWRLPCGRARRSS